MTLRASSSFPKSSRHCYPFLSDGFHDTSNAFPFLTAAKAQSDFERRDEGANDESRRSAKKREQTTFAYDEQFMRSLNTEENSARRLPALDDAQILLLLQRKREEDEDEDEDEDEEVMVVEEEKPPPGTSSFSSLWATEAQFAKDAATLERLMLEQVKEATAAAKRTAEKKRSEDETKTRHFVLVCLPVLLGRRAAPAAGPRRKHKFTATFEGILLVQAVYGM